MNAIPSPTGDFDLQPDPRILPMLGEINLLQWRCLAELIDNSVDGFLASKRDGLAVESPEVSIALPTRDSENAKVTVRDNGPGMAPAQLERAVSAGWSGNTPIDSLGMFGMGFNIATARLGTVTTVWTTRKEDSEWHGLRIDFEELRSQGHFRTPHLTRTKVDPAEHGTEITIDTLKPAQRTWLSSTANRSRVRRELSRTYSAMLRSAGIPISFSLLLNGTKINGRDHCVWDDTRSVETPRHGIVTAYQTINQQLRDRPFCLSCWQWLPSGQGECLSCAENGKVVERSRRVRGWIGLQRYLHKTDYGIDFIRNGRKIEMASKDLFSWSDGETEEPEYPIDDPRGRGRIVGEIHLDHCRVTYTKDRFDRNDPAWEEMLRMVRGDGPLLPSKAKDLGFGANASPLFKLFQAFRRSTPKPKTAGCWERLLIVQDNDHATEMASRFHAGETSYQDDGKWWELVQEQDRQLLGDGGAGGSATGTLAPLPGFGEVPSASPEDTADGGGEEPTTPIPVAPPVRTPLLQLTQEYSHEPTGQRWNVEAYSVEADDLDLGEGNPPWRIVSDPQGRQKFLVCLTHDVFRSATMTPLDGLLAELAWFASDFLRNQDNALPFATILADLRERYARVSTLDQFVLESEAKSTLTAIAKTLRANIEPADGQALFDEMPPTDKEQTLEKMSVRSITTPQDVIASGGFFQHAPWRALLACFSRNAHLFFDGKCWDRPYEDLDLGNERVTERAKLTTVSYFEGLLNDAIWLAEQDLGEVADTDRARLLRASLSLELLAPVVLPGDAIE